MPRSRKRTRGKKNKRRATSSSSSTCSSSSSSSSSDGHRARKSRRTRRASPAVSQNVILSSVIPEFDPLVDDIEMWINVVEANARAFSWSDRVLQYQALQKLRNTHSCMEKFILNLNKNPLKSIVLYSLKIQAVYLMKI